jgi:hypothetical protein
MISDSLRGIDEELDRLLGRRDELAAEVEAAERSERFGADNVREAREKLTDVERRRMAGEDVAAEARKAEAALAKAQASSAEPWRERAEGGRRAVRDVDHEIATMITMQFDRLLAVLTDEAEAARERCDEALEQVAVAYRAREATAARIDGLAATIRRPRFGDVALTRMEPVVREATKLIESGGERAPALIHDPRVPRSGAIAAQDSPYAPVRFA